MVVKERVLIGFAICQSHLDLVASAFTGWFLATRLDPLLRGFLATASISRDNVIQRYNIEL